MNRCLWVFLIAGVSALSQGEVQAEPRARHEFSMADWVALNDARATAISVQSKVLYRRVGTRVGPTRIEWWTADASGDAAVKLAAPEGFSPVGFTRDGRRLYGLWKIDGREQLAIVPVESSEVAAAVQVLTLLPRGIVSVIASPDGTRFAIIADPRMPDELDHIRHVMQPSEVGTYVVNADGSGGKWWCSGVDRISDLPAWSRDSQTVALLTALPRIGHHSVRTEVDV